MPKTKIKVQLTGNDGNVFGIIGAVAKALKRADRRDLADEFEQKAFKSESYDDVITLCKEYVVVGQIQPASPQGGWQY